MKKFKIINWVVCAITVLFLTTACSSNVDDIDMSCLKVKRHQLKMD